MKTLKFRKELADQILDGKKTSTWRLFDDKNLSNGDEISLIIWETGEQFAVAKIIDVIEKSFNELNEKDFEGHEKFNSKEQMYKNYSKFYNKQINQFTKLKIIKFKLIK